MAYNRSSPDTGHTILFMQPTDEESRTYNDYKSIDDALYGLCELFEETYKERNGISGDIVYEIDDVIAYFSNFQEVLMMIFDTEFNCYVPRDTDWIVDKLNNYATKMSQVDSQSTSRQNAMDDAQEEDWDDDDPDKMM